MKFTSVIALGIVCVAQWFVPFNMIYEQEALRADGKIFRFETEPVDPVDPYRGNYLNLSFKADRLSGTEDDFEPDDVVCVLLGQDSAGFAKILSVSAEVPSHTTDYVTAKVNNVYDGNIYIQYPFERFYLEESKAMKAEQVYNDNSSRHVAYAEVHIKNGKAAIADVKINGKSVVDIVREYNSR
jgi:uncharacterized membrane-anchored protein